MNFGSGGWRYARFDDRSDEGGVEIFAKLAASRLRRRQGNALTSR